MWIARRFNFSITHWNGWRNITYFTISSTIRHTTWCCVIRFIRNILCLGNFSKILLPNWYLNLILGEYYSIGSNVIWFLAVFARQNWTKNNNGLWWTLFVETIFHCRIFCLGQPVCIWHFSFTKYTVIKMAIFLSRKELAKLELWSLPLKRLSGQRTNACWFVQIRMQLATKSPNVCWKCCTPVKCFDFTHHLMMQGGWVNASNQFRIGSKTHFRFHHWNICMDFVYWFALCVRLET